MPKRRISKNISRKQIRSGAVGHAAHTQDAQAMSLPGTFDRPIKVTVTGAGSGFTPRILNDILRTPGEAGGVIGLVDLDRGRLRTMARVIRMLLGHLGKTNWKVVASEDRRKVLKGTDYLINCIEVSGPACVTFDNDIPLKYGIDQCIGDTIGPGGLFKALRTIPAWLDILRDCEELCPGADRPQLHQPDGHAVHGGEPDQLNANRRAMPQRSGDEQPAGPLRRRALSRAGLGMRGDQPPCLVHAASAQGQRSCILN
jgi:hypothetical protein